MVVEWVVDGVGPRLLWVKLVAKQPARAHAAEGLLPLRALRRQHGVSKLWRVHVRPPRLITADYC